MDWRRPDAGTCFFCAPDAALSIIVALWQVLDAIADRHKPCLNFGNADGKCCR
ncbi:hypothetical protein NC990_20125 [Funiculus sociatus GB2-M1]|uniref:hypothetical protein n=1 Tax=Trichocoleus sp. FACHB-6 TaxID=2692873 RepID=UPI0016821130|nr:hypothetical protein [Trichocoleus sp. FACHB-6]